MNDLGNIDIAQTGVEDNPSTNLKNLDAIRKTNLKLQEQVDEIIKKDEFPLILGDHSIAIGTMAGVTQNYSLVLSGMMHTEI